MHRDTLIQLAAAAVLVICLGASVLLTGEVAASVGRHKLVYADSAEQGDPPQVAAGIAMGAFRGIFVNYLWMRANTLKEEGKYYEAIDLAKTITRLQPRFPKVWAFHAWNLAYNISVVTQTPQERWNWVQAGIRLLRDQGIPANDNDLLLHKELAWIYLHKIQGYMDDAQRYYKAQLAREWTIVMGKPPTRPLGGMDTDAAKRLYVDRWIRPIADAPDKLDQVYALDPLVRELVTRIKSDAGLELDKSFLERVEIISSVYATARQTNLTAQLDDPLARIMLDDKYAGAGTLLLKHVRKRVLIDEYHMEPERMIRFTLKFGPLDWRHPAAHALYWAARGVEEAGTRVTKDNRADFDFVNTDRLVIQAVQELFRTGLLFYDIANPMLYVTLPNADFLDSYSMYREEALTRGGVFGDRARSRNEYSAGQENFYRDAIRFLYRRGDIAKAEKYYRELRTAPWLNTHMSELPYKLSLPLAEFVVKEITDDERVTSPQVALQEISGALEAAYVEGLLGGNTQVFDSNMQYAQLFHREYQQTQGFKTWVSGEQGRLGFPPFEIFASQIFAGIIMSIGVPQGPIMYQAAPTWLRARAYVFLSASDIKPSMDQAEQAGAPSFDAWFPPPEGVEAVREEMRRFFDQRDGKGTTELK